MEKALKRANLPPRFRYRVPSVAYLGSNGRYNVNGGLGYSGGKPVMRAGVGFSF
jgi:hypothetical protein